MFGRKRDKKRKPGMTQAEISKLEEVGIRRGLFGKKITKKDKDEGIQKHDISGPLPVQVQGGDEKTELPSVLQRATKYGQVVAAPRKLSTSSSSTQRYIQAGVPVDNSNERPAGDGSGAPVAPLRRKASAKLAQEQPSQYDVPKATEHYAAPRPTNHSSNQASVVQSNKYAVPRSSKPLVFRTVVLKKKAAGDFGLSLRRSEAIEIVNNKEVKRTIYFVEPGQAMQSSPDDDPTNRLYPGDRLIEIDRVNVENAARGEIVNRIKSAGSQVSLLVQSAKGVEVTDAADRKEPHYSTPRKAEPPVRSGIKTVPSLSNRVQDDETPKLPATKKIDDSKDRKLVTEKTKSRCTKRPTNGFSDPVTNGKHSEESERADRTARVTPSELHASSTRNGSRPVEGESSADSSCSETIDISPPEKSESTPVRVGIELPKKEAFETQSSGAIEERAICERTNSEVTKMAEDGVDGVCDGSDCSEEQRDLDAVHFSLSQSSLPEQENDKPKPLPDVIQVPNQPGAKWNRKDKIWYRTADGLSEGYIVAPDAIDDDMQVPEGKSRIELVKTNEIFLVPEDDVEMANDTKQDREVDLSKLRHLNESSVLHSLRQRYTGGLNFTLTGPHLIAVRLPYEHSANSYNFTEQIRQGYKGTRLGDSAPHLYGVAQRAHRDMVVGSNDQCLLELGTSGSGKSANIAHLLTYFATVGANASSPLTVEKVSSVPILLQSFSAAANRDCKNSSRCVHVYNLDFDRSGQLAAVSVQALLLERSRLVKRRADEANFNIFYQLLYGANTQLRRELFLLDAEHESNHLITSNFTAENSFHQMAVKGFANLQSSFDSLGLKQDEVKAIYLSIAACLHLGMAGAQKVDGGKYQFARADSAQRAASLLGVSTENLSKTIFQSVSPGKRMRSSSSASLKRSNSSLSSASSLVYQNEDNRSGQQCLDSFIVSLYAEVFRSVISLVNRALTSPLRAQTTIVVVDAPGYQGFSGADGVHSSYADLTFNYVQDRLHSLFYHSAFTTFKDRYQQEGIDCEVLFPDSSFSSSVDAVDQPPTIGGSGAKGLLWILDEEAASPGATDESFVERLLLHYGKPLSPNDTPVVQRSSTKGCFSIRHQAGAFPVHYDASGWLGYAIYNSTVSTVSEIFQDSKKNCISELFASIGDKMNSVAGMKLDAGGSTLKRGSSFRKAWSSASGAAAVKKSTCMMSKFQTDGLIDAIRRTQPHFIFTLAPHPSDRESPHQGLPLDIVFLRRQLRGFQLLNATRTHKQGYPEHVVFADFRRRFDVVLRHLAPGESSNSTSISLLDDREATEKIIEHVELSRSQYRLGVSQVFFRSGVLASLEDRRNEKVSTVLIAFQARCRGYLARRRHERRKIQVVAVRCIQRNIRKFMAIRQWPWWRLLTKVLPLVEVTRTEEELRETQGELELVKERFGKVQSERDELKQSNAKYEAKIQDLVVLLEEERNTATHASDLLEHERKERLRLEKLLKDTQLSHNDLLGRMETMEVELAEKRLLYSEHINLDSDDEDEGGEYKMRYEKAVRDFNFQMKKKSQENDDALEELIASKKSVDKKLVQLQEELEDQMRIESQTKKKLHKVNAELSDATIHLEETATKNQELEKKQRKFDSEMYAAQATITELKTSRDRILREKDRIALEKNDLDKDILEKSDEIDSLRGKLKRLEEELEDTDKKDSDDHRMVNNLKKQIREMDAKLKDQEEELEEQASTIHTLEHAKERLEMSAEHGRQQRQREVEGKDEELEEMRTSYHKKIKLLESQLEEGEEERSAIARQKRDLEQELNSARDHDQGHDVEMEKRLRRDLKRYKALLADAQTMIDHLKADVASKQQVKQLKAQVEDLEYTSATAVKSKKAIELELEDLQSQLDEVSKSKQEAESRMSNLLRETHDLRSKLEDDAEDAQETLRKYRSLVNQQTEDRRQLVELQVAVDVMKQEKNQSEEKIQNLQSQIHFLESNTTDNSTVQRLESKVKDYETKLEFQKTTTKRLEVQLSRAKENVEKMSTERDSHASAEHREKEAAKRLQRQLRESKDEQGELLKREQEALHKKHELEMELAEHESQIDSLQADLKLAFKRISDLQASLEELEDSDLEYGDDATSSDEEVSSKYGWRSRLSTSGYSARTRSMTSSRTNSPSNFSSIASLKQQPSSARSSKKEQDHSLTSRNKRQLFEALPIDESMSHYGKAIADSVRSAGEARNRKGSISSSCASKVAVSDQSAIYSKPLDRVSRSLADEDPSFILYASPSKISRNLGLGRASSFHALNESLHAVKRRQNLPEQCRTQLNARDRVKSDIARMKMTSRPTSALSGNDDDDDVRSVASYGSHSYFDLDDDSLSSRPSSCIRRVRSSSITSDLTDRVAKPHDPPSDPYRSQQPNETDLILARHHNLKRTRDKPFTSRFLEKVKQQRHQPVNSSNMRPKSNTSSFPPHLPNGYLSDGCTAESSGRTSVRKSNYKALRSDIERSYSSDVDDLYTDSDRDIDDDDVSLSRYGVCRQFDEQYERPRSRLSCARGQSRIGNGIGSDYEDVDPTPSDPEQSDPLDAVIRKYLYRK